MFDPKQNILDQQLAESGLELNILGTIGDFFTGGATTQNKYNKKVAKTQNKYQKKLYKFEGEELAKQYEYAVQGQNIAKANLLADLKYQSAVQQQKWNYGMAIRDYEFKQAMKAYGQSVMQATQQKGFNEVADKFANLQADRSLMEQQIELALSKQETLLNYTAQAHGLVMQKKKTKDAAVSRMRQTNLAALKAKGSAASLGQGGRTAGKSLNAIQMEANAVESEIVNELMTDTAQIDMDLMVSRMQNMQDNLALELSENNLIASDKLTRQMIAMQRAQADLQAEASIMLKPEIAPPIPKPLAMPIPQFQEIYKPTQGPKPAKNIPYQANLVSAFANKMINLGSTAASLFGGG